MGSSHIPDAPHLTVELTFEIIDSWPKDAPIIFYSNPGRRRLDKALTFARTASPTREASLAEWMLGISTEGRSLIGIG